MEKTGQLKMARAWSAAFLTGFASLWIQVLILRRVMASFSGNELTLGVGLAAWMIGSGAGAALGRRHALRFGDPGLALAAALASSSVLLAPALLAAARMRPWLALTSGEAAGLGHAALAAFILAAPFAAAMGFCFNLCVRMAGGSSAPYRNEAAGAAVAGAFSAAWYAFGVKPLEPALIFILLAVPSSLLLATGARWKKAAAVLSPVIFAGLLFGGGSMEELYLRAFWGERDVLASLDSRYAYLAAVRRGEETTIYMDGAPSATFPNPAGDEVMVHLPLVMCAKPESVLIIGGSFSGPAALALKHGVNKVEFFDLDPSRLQMEKEFAPEAASVLADPLVKITIGDPRALIRERRGEFDAVILNLPDPLTASLGRFYTMEFMAEIARALKPGGVAAVFAAETPPNRSLSPAQLAMLAGTVKTVESVFPHRVVLPLSRNLIVAGLDGSRLTTGATEIDARLKARGVDSYYAASSMTGPDLDPVYVADLEERLAKTPAEPFTGLHPRGYLIGIMLWAEKTTPGAAPAIAALSRAPVWIIAFIPLLSFLACGVLSRSPRGAALGAMFVSGFSAMVFEVSALIAYQIAAGAVYFAISLLSASFMVGIAAGAWLEEKRDSGVGKSLAAQTLAIALSMAATALFIKGTCAFLSTAVFSFLLLIAGAGAGMVFPAAAKLMGKDGAGSAYGADLIGGALGGLVTGAVLIPVFGLLNAMAASLLAVAAAAAVFWKVKGAD